MKKKYFLLLCFFFIILLSLFSFNEWKRNNISNFIIIETNFKNNHKIFTDDLITTKIYKNNIEIKGFTLFSNTIFRVEEGLYKVESYFGNQYFEETIYKAPYSHKALSFSYEPNEQMDFFYSFNKTLVFIIFIFNIGTYIAATKLVKRNSFLLNLTFIFLIFLNFLDFVSVFTKMQYFILQMISFVSINILFLINSFKFINIKKDKIIKYIFIFMAISFIFLGSFIFLFFPSVQIYLLYHKILFLIFFYFMSILAFIVDYSIIVIPALYFFSEWRKSKGKLKVLTIYQILFLLLFLIIEILLEFFDIDIFLSNNILDNIRISVFFWIIYFNLNIDTILKYFKNIEFFTIYVFKYVVIVQIIYLYAVITKQCTIILPAIITCLIGDHIYILIKYLINSSRSEYNSLFKKLNGIDNIEIFENIIEKELSKKESVQKILFKVFIDEHEKYNYIINDDDKIILTKRNLKNEYREFHFGIEAKINNKCIALLLIKSNNGKGINEEKVYYKEILEELIDYIIYVRTLYLKRKLSNEHKKSFIDQTTKEEIQLIKEFAILINKHTVDDKIKMYSKIIIDKSEKLGESDV